MPEVEILTQSSVLSPDLIPWSRGPALSLSELPVEHCLPRLKLVCHWPCPGLSCPGTLLVLASLLDSSLCKTCVLQDLGQIQRPPGPLLETVFPSAEFQLLFISLMRLIFYVQETIPFSQIGHFINIGWMMSLRIMMKLTYVSQEFVKSIRSVFGNIWGGKGRGNALTYIAWGSIKRYNLCSRVINVRALGPSKIPPLGMILFSMKWQMY